MKQALSNMANSHIFRVTNVIAGRGGLDSVKNRTNPTEKSTIRKSAKAPVEADNISSSIIQLVHDAIIAVDEDQNIFLFNQGAEQTFGNNASEVACDSPAAGFIRNPPRPHPQIFYI